MIATPLYDGKLDVWYANSLCETIKMSYEKEVFVKPMWVSNDALIQRCRNDLLDMFVKSDFDYIFWIDGDIEWEPEKFFSLLDSGLDVVGGTYPKKSDTEEYVCRLNPNKPLIKSKYIEVGGLGTGFLLMSKKAALHLYEYSTKYHDPRQDERAGLKSMAFDVRVIDGELYSEDIIACMTLIECGFKLYLDTTITCNHVGSKKYVGNFEKYYWKSRQIL